MTPWRYELTCVLAALVVLAAGAANKIRLGAAPDAAPFLLHVREAASRVTGDVPGMSVKRGRLPRQAFEVLHPNVLESRTYTDLADGTTFSVLLVHCGDVNDMGAHYPPACYPASGLTVTDTAPMELAMGELTLSGVEYTLDPSRIDERTPIRVWNCMFLPGGISTYEPATLRKRGRTDNRRYYGAGQIQILVDASIPEARRRAIYKEALAVYEPVLRGMLSDPRKPFAAENPREITVHD
jgi:hypothetical protein